MQTVIIKGKNNQENFIWGAPIYLSKNVQNIREVLHAPFPSNEGKLLFQHLKKNHFEVDARMTQPVLTRL